MKKRRREPPPVVYMEGDIELTPECARWILAFHRKRGTLVHPVRIRGHPIDRLFRRRRFHTPVEDEKE